MSDKLMTGPRPFQSADGPVQAPSIPTEAEYRAQQAAKRTWLEARWARARAGEDVPEFRKIKKWVAEENARRKRDDPAS